ncbi:MAG: M24 family metallopeptidase C-terminal domain-containing protein, partial [Lachnospiraceae bacterium]|nr:M24 family metallopeptidase C-terminal domain-containing protein [Lachnospiraceae bacterium]
ITDQANHISAKIKAEFGVDPEFPFTVKGSGREKEQDKGSAVFRHKDTGKWFAIIMTISGSKLEGYGAVSDKNSLINVMNVKIYPDELGRLLDEPGLYREGRFGVRLESILMVKEAEQTEDGTFYGFECLTYVPLDDKGIDRSLLTSDERELYERYQKEVYDRLKDSLDENERKWLRAYAGIDTATEEG